MNSGGYFLICLADAKDGHFTSKCPFIIIFREFVSNRNTNYLRKYVNSLVIRGVYREYHGVRGGRGGYYSNMSDINKRKD